jgi:hypothetical protein
MKTLSAFVVLFVLAGLPFRADAQSVTLYDDFSRKFIDPDKWLVLQSCGDNSGSRECVLEIKGGQLRQENRTYGNTDSDAGGNFSGVFLNFSNPSAITAIKADVTVKDFAVSGCRNDPNITGQTRARLAGSFFNTDTPTAGSYMNDVAASINLERQSSFTDPKNTLRVTAFANVCGDTSCSTGPSLGFLNLGTVSKGEIVSLTISWEQANQRFKFTASAPTLPGQLTGFISYTVSDTAPSGANLKFLGVNNFTPNCTSTPRPVAYMEALFDNVFVAP